MKSRTSVAMAAGIGLFALVMRLYFETTLNRPLHPTAGPPRLQASQTFTQGNHTYDEAEIPFVPNQQYAFHGISFTYLGNDTADADQCPPADLKPFNELYPFNEIKHFSAILKNGTKVSMDTCWPLPYTPVIISDNPPTKTAGMMQDSIYFVHGVPTGLQKRWETRWFDPDSETAGIIQNQTYFVPGKTAFYYFTERTGQ
ncbi:MAG TPA: hypothetical protein VF016_10115 [Nitrososphaera sp.]